MEKVQAIINLYNKYGLADYIGEKVSQLEHAIQSAFYAEAFIQFGNKKGKLSNIIGDVSLYDINIDESTEKSIIVAALLHDIGHLLYFEDTTIALMGNLGVSNHEELGSLYLQKMGFNKLVIYLVKSHVMTKRYLITKFPTYKQTLSRASLQTLEHQGGELTSEQIATFESDPWHKYAILLRVSDDYAKVPNCNYNDISYYKDMITSCVNF